MTAIAARRALRNLDLAMLDARIAAATRQPTPVTASAGAAVEVRAATTQTVNTTTRTITVVAVPYEEPTAVPFRNDIWHEVFDRSAFRGITVRAPRIPVTREHNPALLVGKVAHLDPDHRAGLLATVTVAKTLLGDETLQLAEADCLSASVGFGVTPSGQQLDYGRRVRRITRALLDHLSLVGSPAYAGANVLGVA